MKSHSKNIGITANHYPIRTRITHFKKLLIFRKKIFLSFMIFLISIKPTLHSLEEKIVEVPWH